MYLKMFIFDDF